MCKIFDGVGWPGCWQDLEGLLLCGPGDTREDMCILSNLLLVLETQCP